MKEILELIGLLGLIFLFIGIIHVLIEILVLP